MNEQMKIFVIGASGYIGGSIATALVSTGHEVIGLCRSNDKAALLKQRNIEPVLGTLRDEQILFQTSRSADAVINAADADDPFVVEVLLRALAGSGKKLIHTSGSSIVGDRAAGEYSDRVFCEDIPRPIRFEKIGRVAVDTEVIKSAICNVHSVVVCPCLIYGYGTGLKTQSIQVPRMVELAKKHQTVRYIGRGENIWSTVHIEDVASAYMLALEKAPAGSFFFLENGESSFREIAETIQNKLGFGGTAQSWTVEAAVQEWGQEGAHFAFGSNSRIRSEKARSILGWTPKHSSVIDWLKETANL
ncbi:MAG: NAD-dependent epimerase/dehydratase family protein [Leptolyngbyaceae cyanobacterium RM2_2_4]|nr:NAD-dependent epimerase/dehydratase family protein [Leptolyngbyaceae cyanobacterium RM2_2_4]NJO67119.1 NAD-dependent epimerase/dehydratase family protein [Leptolyngbyaceae cyanobacterium RM1_405_57]